MEFAQRHAQNRPQARIETQDVSGGIELLLRDRERIQRARRVDDLRQGWTPSS
jgi:hypothetical protein